MVKVELAPMGMRQGDGGMRWLAALPEGTRYLWQADWGTSFEVHNQALASARQKPAGVGEREDLTAMIKRLEAGEGK